jgi:hypothetical protein
MVTIIFVTHAEQHLNEEDNGSNQVARPRYNATRRIEVPFIPSKRSLFFNLVPEPGTEGAMLCLMGTEEDEIADMYGWAPVSVCWDLREQAFRVTTTFYFIFPPGADLGEMHVLYEGWKFEYDPEASRKGIPIEEYQKRLADKKAAKKAVPISALEEHRRRISDMP